MCGKILLWFQKCKWGKNVTRTVTSQELGAGWFSWGEGTTMRWSTLRCRWGNPQGWRGGEGYDPGSLRSDSSGFLTAHHGGSFLPLLLQVVWPGPLLIHSLFSIQCLLSIYYVPSTVTGVKNWMVNSNRWGLCPPGYESTVYPQTDLNSARALRELDNWLYAVLGADVNVFSWDSRPRLKNIKTWRPGLIRKRR